MCYLNAKAAVQLRTVDTAPRTFLVSGSYNLSLATRIPRAGGGSAFMCPPRKAWALPFVNLHGSRLLDATGHRCG